MSEQEPEYTVVYHEIVDQAGYEEACKLMLEGLEMLKVMKEKEAG